MLRLTLNNTHAQVVAALQVKQDKLVSALLDKMTYLMQRLQQKIVGEKLSGQVLSRRSGRLADSIIAEPAILEGTDIVGRVAWAGGEAWYGKVHEFGGTRDFVINVQASRREWRRAGVLGKRALRFMLGGKEVFTPYVFHPPLPKRPFMAPSLEEMREEIKEGLRERILEVMRGESR